MRYRMRKLAQLLELSTVIFANETETAFLCEEFGLKEIRDLFQNEKLQILVETLGAEEAVCTIGTADKSVRRKPAPSVRCAQSRKL